MEITIQEAARQLRMTTDRALYLLRHTGAVRKSGLHRWPTFLIDPNHPEFVHLLRAVETRCERKALAPIRSGLSEPPRVGLVALGRSFNNR